MRHGICRNYHQNVDINIQSVVKRLLKYRSLFYEYSHLYTQYWVFKCYVDSSRQHSPACDHMYILHRLFYYVKQQNYTCARMNAWKRFVAFHIAYFYYVFCGTSVYHGSSRQQWYPRTVLLDGKRVNNLKPDSLNSSIYWMKESKKRNPFLPLIDMETPALAFWKWKE